LQEEEQYEVERALIENLDALDEPGVRVRLRARSGRGDDALGFLETVRDEDSAEPFWLGVKRMTAAGGAADLEWHDPIEPRPLEHGDVTVECHLYDDDALAEAERRRTEAVEV
jgi:hypothetical protein